MSDTEVDGEVVYYDPRQISAMATTIYAAMLCAVTVEGTDPKIIVAKRGAAIRVAVDDALALWKATTERSMT